MSLALPTAESVKVKMPANRPAGKFLSKLAGRSVFWGLKKGSIQPHETNLSKTLILLLWWSILDPLCQKAKGITVHWYPVKVWSHTGPRSHCGMYNGPWSWWGAELYNPTPSFPRRRQLIIHKHNTQSSEYSRDNDARSVVSAYTRDEGSIYIHFFFSLAHVTRTLKELVAVFLTPWRRFSKGQGAKNTLMIFWQLRGRKYREEARGKRLRISRRDTHLHKEEVEKSLPPSAIAWVSYLYLWKRYRLGPGLWGIQACVNVLEADAECSPFGSM